MRPSVSLPMFAGALVLATPVPAQQSPVRRPVATAMPMTPVTLDSVTRAAYRWRNIGPDRGGRSIAVSGVRGRRQEAYFGATGGGLWKTTDGGETWAPVTDGQVRSASVGAVAVSESHPDVVYIGMGETALRGNIMPGDGIYKSTDAGKTWTHVGFRTVDAIGRIRIHPTNPDIVLAAVFGRYSAPSSERGIYKTTDGGRTWRRVLFRDDRTGGVDLWIDRRDPNVVFAALWEAYRVEYQMSSGGPGSGLFKSTDGGETWTEITRNPGLPAGLVGKIGVSVSGADSRRVYAMVENENGGLFVSDDAGATWRLANASRTIRQRAFYYSHVTADVADRDLVYLQNVSMYKSTDAGKTLTPITGSHGDWHDLWVDPDDPRHLVVANDGGGAVSFDGGQRWTAEDYPTAQFYHVITTAHTPYHVCGSQQDNTTMCTPYNWNAAAFGFAGTGGRRGGGGNAPAGDITTGSTALSYVAGGGEPGYIAPDPRDPDIFYAGTNNGGYVDKYNRRLNVSREVNPYPWFYSGEPSKAIRERWQWTFPIIFSKADPTRLYVSSQRLWMTRDGGRTWTRLSGDLTRADPKTQEKSGGPITGDMNGPEVYGTIFAVGPGKRNVDVIWTGSDDGLVHVTRDGGRTWTNVTPPQMPEFGRVSQIDASAFDDGAAYVSVRRPLLDDHRPYIFKTKDFGRTWTTIVAGLRDDDYVHVVREDPARRGLLYAGTQHGVYASWDDGATWQSISFNFPDVPVSDLIVERNELVISSHGRSFWVLDNIAPLRQLTPAVQQADAHLFTPVEGVRSGYSVTFSWRSARPAAAARLDIVDSVGTVLRSYTHDTLPPAAGGAPRPGGGGPWVPLEAGVQRLSWDLRAAPIVGFPGMILWGAGLNGPAVPPGRYTARLTLDGRTLTTSVRVVRNPWITDVTDADLRAQFAFGRRVAAKATEANRAVIAIRSVKAQAADRTKRSDDAALAAAVATLTRNASAVEESIYQVRNQSNQDPLNFPIKVNNRLANLLAMSERGDGPPGTYMPEILDILSAELKGYTDTLAQVWATDLAAVNRALARLRLPAVDPACGKVEGCAVP